MSITLALVIAISGLILVIYFSEQLVKGITGTSLGFHISAFLISVIFLGFDPENLGVGAVGSYESVSGIAMGSIIGAAMVAMAFALGITAILAPLKFQKISWQLLLVPLVSVLLFGSLAWDRELSRWDGLLLLLAYTIAVVYLVYLNRKGVDLKAGGEVAETLEKEEPPGKWRSVLLMLFSLAAIIAGSEMLVTGSNVLLEEYNISDTVYGMTILAFLVSIEEIARELPAAMKGKSDITMGNVIGSVLAFFLFNAGWIAMVRPLQITEDSLHFYLPVSIITILIILVSLYISQKINRLVGAILLVIYFIFVGYGWIT